MPDPIAPVATDTPAAPSAPAPAAESRAPDTSSREERRAWLDAHKAPGPASAVVETDDEPEAAPVAGTPAPVAGQPTKGGPDLSRFVKTPPPPGVSNRDHVRKELIRFATESEQRIRDLEAQLQQRTAPPAPRTDPPAAPPPAEEYDGSDPNDPRPTSIEQFHESEDPYAALLFAQFEWKQRKDGRKAQHAEQRTTAERTAIERQTKFNERATAYAATRPDFKAKTETVRANIHPQSPMAAWLMDSPVSSELLDHLSDHPEDFQRIARASSYEAAHAAFVKLEARLESSADSSSTPAAGTPATPAPNVKLVSSAPPPPPTLGTRPAEPADEEKAAVARDDFAAFKRIALRKRIAKRSGQ